MDIVTWNLNGLEPKSRGPRTEAAMFTMLLGGLLEDIVETGPRRAPPAVVLLQEVVEPTYFAHLQPHLKAAGYTLFPTEIPARGYFEVIAVRAPILEARTVRFDATGMGRALNQVTLDGLTVFTAHLESLKPGRPLRMEQAQEVLDALARIEGPALFGGDTNLREDEAAALSFPDGILDAWTSAGSPKRMRNTWGRMRYDRFWLKGLACGAFETIGAADVPGIGEPPSDHLGLRISVEASA